MDLDRHDPRSLPQSWTSKRVVFLDPLEGVRTEEEEVSFLLHFRSSREHKAPEATLSRAPRQHNDTTRQLRWSSTLICFWLRMPPLKLTLSSDALASVSAVRRGLVDS
jgi:hypothetical protein